MNLLSQDNQVPVITSSFLLNTQDTIMFYSKAYLPLYFFTSQIILEIVLEFPLACLHLVILLVHGQG